MNHVITLHQIRIENANMMAGFTYGFPAITHFLGYVHALSRKLAPLYGIQLEGCAVICHAHQLHVNRKNTLSDYRFNLTRNPLDSTGKPVPFMEEGRMQLTLSLIIPCAGFIGGDVQRHALVCEAIKEQALQQRIAGGRIIDIAHCYSQDFPNKPQKVRTFLRAFLPGFMLVDGFSVFQAHYEKKRETQPESSLLDAWLDFCAVSEYSEPYSASDKKRDQQNVPEAQWVFKPQTEIGYYVPLMVGYKRISELYPPRQAQNLRDSDIPWCMTEAALGIGQWLSPTRIGRLDDAIWNYAVKDPYYVCQCTAQQIAQTDAFVTLDDD